MREKWPGILRQQEKVRELYPSAERSGLRRTSFVLRESSLRADYVTLYVVGEVRSTEGL